MTSPNTDTTSNAGKAAITCGTVRRHYLRDDFLRYLLNVSEQRRVVLCTASQPVGRYQQCRPRLTASDLGDLTEQIASWLDGAFTDLRDDDVPIVYPSLHYAVCRHWEGGRDWVIEADADDWRRAWEKIEPLVGIIEVLEIPYTLRYSGHVSPHLCLAEEDFPEPPTLSEALKLNEQLTTALKPRLAEHDAHILGPIARLPYSLNENAGFVCIEVPRGPHGTFDPASAHPERINISPTWPPSARSGRALRLLEWAKGERDVHGERPSLFSRSAASPTPMPVESSIDREAEFNRLCRSLTSELESAPSPVEDSAEPIKGMVRVPAGPFISGSPWGVRELGRPVMRIAQTHAYFIDTCPVTNAQYAKFVRNRGYDRKEFWSAEGWEFVRTCNWHGPSEPCETHPAECPVCGVSFFEAEAYARWCRKRLPTFEEWEKGCRGTDGRRWPWGNDFDATPCNTADRRGPGEEWKPSPVGAFPKGVSPLGCLDMVGNVWEWLGDVTVIGGSFASHLTDSDCCEYHGQEPHYRPGKVGFRCVKD